MKPFFQVFFLLIFANLHAQTWHTAVQPFYKNRIFDVQKDPFGEMLIFLSDNTSSSFLPLGIVRIDSLGKTQTIYVNSPGQPMQPYLLPFEGGYFITDFFFECDILTSRWIARYDTAGKALWANYLDGSLDPDMLPASLFPGVNNSFWLFRTGKPPLNFDSNGELIQTGTVVFPVFRGIAGKLPFGWLTYGEKGLAAYSPTLQTTIQALSYTDILDAEILPGGNVLALTKKALYKLNAFLAPLDSVKSPANFNAFRLAVTGGSQVKIIGENGTKLAVLDTSLSSVNVLLPPNNQPVPTWVFGTSQHWMMIGSDRTNIPQLPEQAIGITANQPQEFDFFDENGPDSGVEGIRVDTILLYPSNFSPTFGMNIPSIEVTVKNFGKDTLKQVRINGYLGSFNYICNEVYANSTKFDDLNIAPGDTATFELGPLYNYGFGAPQTFEICLWTSTPNDSLDARHSNDSYCQTFPVTVSSSQPQVVPVAVFPNPATELCTLSWGEGNADITLINAAGQIIYEAQGAYGQFSLLKGQWPVGVYWVVIKTDDGKLGREKIIFID